MLDDIKLRALHYMGIIHIERGSGVWAAVASDSAAAELPPASWRTWADEIPYSQIKHGAGRNVPRTTSVVPEAASLRPTERSQSSLLCCSKSSHNSFMMTFDNF